VRVQNNNVSEENIKFAYRQIRSETKIKRNSFLIFQKQMFSITTEMYMEMLLTVKNADYLAVNYKKEYDSTGLFLKIKVLNFHSMVTLNLFLRDRD
jgi:uncharacterized protein YccT (UPF0319 family)